MNMKNDRRSQARAMHKQTHRGVLFMVHELTGRALRKYHRVQEGFPTVNLFQAGVFTEVTARQPVVIPTEELTMCAQH